MVQSQYVKTGRPTEQNRNKQICQKVDILRKEVVNLIVQLLMETLGEKEGISRKAQGLSRLNRTMRVEEN